MPARLWGCSIRARAASKICAREYVHTAKSDDVLFIRVDVLGFRPEELELTIESRRLTIAGRRRITHHRRRKKIIYLDQSRDLMLRILQLPVEVDPDQSTATLRGDSRSFIVDSISAAQHTIRSRHSMGCIENSQPNSKQDHFFCEQVKQALTNRGPNAAVVRQDGSASVACQSVGNRTGRHWI